VNRTLLVTTALVASALATNVALAEGPAAPAIVDASKPEPKVAAPAGVADSALDFLKSISVSGYVQAQYERHQDSEDQIRQGGSLLNQNRFSVRRGRLKVERQWEYASVMLELDASTTKGPTVVPQHAEASLQYRGGNGLTLPPMVKLTFGIFDLPYGYELVESPKTRFFMERSLASRSFFPSEPDVGVRLTSAIGWLRTAVAVVNGSSLSDKAYPYRDPDSFKDIVARAGFDVSPTPWLELQGGASVLNGHGFHAGSDATKNGVVWKDANENGTIDLGELQAVPGSSGTPSQTFHRWAVGGDLRVGVKTPIGWTRVSGELTAASNLDRGLYVADPTLTNIDTREVGFVAGITQELFEYGVVGLRFDQYDPNQDSQDKRGGKLLPTSAAIRTFSPMVGLTLPNNAARLIFQYDIVKDHLGRDPQGVPADLENNAWSLRLQVAL
jgi:hypothetical protein